MWGQSERNCRGGLRPLLRRGHPKHINAARLHKSRRMRARVLVVTRELHHLRSLTRVRQLRPRDVLVGHIGRVALRNGEHLQLYAQQVAAAWRAAWRSSTSSVAGVDRQRQLAPRAAVPLHGPWLGPRAEKLPVTTYGAAVGTRLF